jgi:hypothetical protein
MCNLIKNSAHSVIIGVNKGRRDKKRQEKGRVDKDLMIELISMQDR